MSFFYVMEGGNFVKKEDMYQHFEFTEELSESLKGIDQYMRASSDTDPEDIHDSISRMKGRILIAIDGKDSTFEYAKSEVLGEVQSFGIMFVEQTENGNAKSVYKAQESCKEYAIQTAKFLMLCYEKYEMGLEELIPESIEIHGVGPVGDCFNGVILQYAVRATWGLKLNPDMWNG